MLRRIWKKKGTLTHMTKIYRDESNGIIRNKNELKKIDAALRRAGHDIDPIEQRIKRGDLVEVTMGYDGEWVNIMHFAPLMEFRRAGARKENR
jgi:hypothetical protein